MRRSKMFASDTPLVPEEQVYARDSIARDLDAEREPIAQRRPAYRRVAMGRPPIGQRMAKSLARFCAAVLIGVGLSLAWQSHSEDAKEIARSWAPSLAWLLPETNINKPAETTGSPELMQQVKLIAVDVAIMRRNLGQIAANQEQFSAKQDQLSQNVLNLAQIEQEVRAQSLSAPAPKPVQPRVRNSPQPLLQPAPQPAPQPAAR
jgi:hypothetical protein